MEKLYAYATTQDCSTCHSSCCYIQASEQHMPQCVVPVDCKNRRLQAAMVCSCNMLAAVCLLAQVRWWVTRGMKFSTVGEHQLRVDACYNKTVYRCTTEHDDHCSMLHDVANICSAADCSRASACSEGIHHPSIVVLSAGRQQNSAYYVSLMF